MPNRDAVFFDELRKCRYIRALSTTECTIRFDIRHRDRTVHWRVTVNRGDVVVSPGTGDADGVFSMDELSFQRLADGETVPFAAFLSNEMGVQGRVGRAAVVQQLFHERPGAHHPRQFAEHDGRRRER